MHQSLIQLQPHRAGHSSTVPSLLCSIAVTTVGLGCLALSTPALAQSSAPPGQQVELEPSQTLSPTTESPTAGEPAESRPVEQAVVSTPSGDRLTVRSGPGASYEIIGSLANGQSLQLSGLTLGNWAQLAGGGWVYVPYLQR